MILTILLYAVIVGLFLENFLSVFGAGVFMIGILTIHMLFSGNRICQN